jgi:hypothetical protein
MKGLDWMIRMKFLVLASSASNNGEVTSGFWSCTQNIQDPLPSSFTLSKESTRTSVRKMHLTFLGPKEDLTECKIGAGKMGPALIIFTGILVKQ